MCLFLARLRRLVAATKVEHSPEPEELVTPSVESEDADVSATTTPTSEAPLVIASPEVELHRHISRFLQQVHKRWAPKLSTRLRSKSQPHIQVCLFIFLYFLCGGLYIFLLYLFYALVFVLCFISCFSSCLSLFVPLFFSILILNMYRY